MTTAYPAALDTFVNPTAASNMSDPTVLHHVQHANLNDAVKAMQARVGVVGSTVAGTLTKRLADAEVAVLGAVQDSLNASAVIAPSANAVVAGLAVKANDAATTAALAGKQASLVSGTNVKSINGVSLLGAGDLAVSGGSALPVTTAFATAITFDAYRSMGAYTVTGALTFTVNATGSAVGGETTLSLIANGTNAPTFTGLALAGSTAYDNTVGRVNEISFFRTASGYYYGVLAGAIVDSIAPTLTSASVANATPSQVDLVFSEAMNALWSVASAFTVVGHTVLSITRLTATTGYLTLTTPFLAGEAARTLGYTQPGTNLMQDLAGNLLATIASAAITNNVVATSGALGVATIAYAPLNVTTSGFLDWTALNDVGLPGTYYRKVAANLIDITAARVNATFSQNGQTIPYSWTAGDSQYAPGAPTQDSSQAMVATNATLFARYRVIFPAGTVSRKARLYFKTFDNGAAATGKFTLRAALSDGSAAPSVTTLDAPAGLQNQAYEWTYTAGIAGQTLTVDIEIAANDYGQLLLDLATYGT